MKWVAATAPSYTFTSFTPSWGNLTEGNATNTGAYVEIGKFVYGWARIAFGSTTSISGNVFLTLPLTAANNPNDGYVADLRLFDSGVANYTAKGVLVDANDVYVVILQTNATYATDGANLNSTTPFTWTTNDVIRMTFAYEKA